MRDSMLNALDAEQMLHRALSRWEDEGGAMLGGHLDGLSVGAAQSEVPPLSDAELVQLRVRVIALENFGDCLVGSRP